MIAVHNMHSYYLSEMIKKGGIPAPSIAIINANKREHEKYGDISVVFSADSINPETNEKNHVFSSDAWTPVVPSKATDTSGTISEEYTLQDIVDMMESRGVSSTPEGWSAEELHTVDEIKAAASKAFGTGRGTAQNLVTKLKGWILNKADAVTRTAKTNLDSAIKKVAESAIEKVYGSEISTTDFEKTYNAYVNTLYTAATNYRAGLNEHATRIVCCWTVR